MSKFIAGFIVGTMLVVFLAIWKEAQTIEPSDLVKSYEKGFQDALNAERPSERLEYVCAALWFKGEKNEQVR
jgi:hypothetical protein